MRRLAFLWCDWLLRVYSRVTNMLHMAPPPNSINYTHQTNSAVVVVVFVSLGSLATAACGLIVLSLTD